MLAVVLALAAGFLTIAAPCTQARFARLSTSARTPLRNLCFQVLRRLSQYHRPQFLAESAGRPTVTIQSRLPGNSGCRHMPRRVATTAAPTDDDECRYAPVALQVPSRWRQLNRAPDCRRS